MEIVIKSSPQEIAALVSQLQERQVEAKKDHSKALCRIPYTNRICMAKANRFSDTCEEEC